MKNVKEAYVEKLPECDICNNGELARYDAMMQDGRWAFMCESHWKELGMFKDLGTGKGQILKEYLPRP